MSNEKTLLAMSAGTATFGPFDHPPPTKGWLSHIPLGAQPYLELMRLDRLHAALYFYIPQLLGSLLVATLYQCSVKELTLANVNVLLFTFFFRGIANAWNDILDVEYDKKVERTRQRPLARGAISVRQGNIFVVGLLGCCFAVYPLFPPACRGFATLWIASAMLYPLSKRFVVFPQGVFGLVMSLGVFVGATSIRIDPVPEGAWSTSGSSLLPFHSPPNIFSDSAPGATLALISLYGAHVAWSISYETIYSYQDVADDQKAGVKNIALLMPNKGKYFLAVWAVASVCCLVLMGRLINAQPSFFTHVIMGLGLILTLQITKVDLQNPASCKACFALGGVTAGVAMVEGLIGEYALRIVT